MAKSKKKDEEAEAVAEDPARVQWFFEDKRRRTLIEKFGEDAGNKRFEAEKAAGFVPAKMWPAVK